MAENSLLSRTPASVNGEQKRPARKILYVEDNAINAMVVRTVLKRMRPEVSLTVCETGAAAHAYLRAERPDFLLIDIMLPDTNGYDLLKAIRTQVTLAGIPAAAISADKTPATAARARASGFCDYLSKPLVANKFLDLLDAVLYRRG